MGQLYQQSFSLSRSTLVQVIFLTQKYGNEMKNYITSSKWHDQFRDISSRIHDFTSAEKDNEEAAHDGDESEAEDGAFEDSEQVLVSKSLPLLYVVERKDCFNTGDFFRYLDRSNVVKKDNVFVYIETGGVISNGSLSPAIASHIARTKLDPQFTPLTAVLCPPTTQLQPMEMACAYTASDTVPLYTYDKRDGRIWSYSLMNSREVTSTLIADVKVAKTAPKEVIPHLETSTKFVETGIYICSPLAIIHFSDHFDFRDIRKEYIRIECANTAVPQRFYLHCSNNYMSGRIEDLKSYGTVSFDVVSGKCGEKYRPSGDFSTPYNRPVTKYSTAKAIAQGPNVYIDSSVVSQTDLSQLVQGAGVVVRKGTTIGSNVQISRTIVGKNCKIGSNVILRNCIIGDNVTIADDSVLSGTIVGDSAQILVAYKSKLGTVIGPKVVLNNPAAPTAFCLRLTADGKAPGEMLKAGDDLVDRSLVGAQGIGRVFPSTQDASWMEPIFEADEDDDEYEDGTEVKHPYGNTEEALETPEALFQEVASYVKEMILLYQRPKSPKTAQPNASSSETKPVSCPDAVSASKSVSAADSSTQKSCGCPFLSIVQGIAPAVRRLLGHRNVIGSAFVPPAISLAIPFLFHSKPIAIVRNAKGDSDDEAFGSNFGLPKTGEPMTVSTSNNAMLKGSRIEPPSMANGRLPAFYKAIAELVASLGAKPTAELLHAASMEVASLRHAENATFENIICGLIPVFLKAIPSPETLENVYSTTKYWSPLFQKFVVQLEHQCLLIFELEKAIFSIQDEVRQGRLFQLFGMILNCFYDMDVINEMAIEDWAESAQDLEDDLFDAEEDDEGGSMESGSDDGGITMDDFSEYSSDEEDIDDVLPETEEEKDTAYLEAHQKLLSTRCVQMLLDKVLGEEDEEEEDEDEDEEEEDDE